MIIIIKDFIFLYHFLTSTFKALYRLSYYMLCMFLQKAITLFLLFELISTA